MEKIALITDSTCDLKKAIVDRYNINVLPFRIIYKDREYRDGIDITPGEVYDNMHIEVPTSSMPAMSDMENLYERLENEGYTHAIAIVLSTGLSGIYNGFKVVSESHHKIKTYLYDSKSISLGEGLLVEGCAKLIEEGKSFYEIVSLIPSIKKKIDLYFVVPTLEYLKKGGRIGKVSGTIAEILDLKPIISPDEEGKYATYAKVRGRKQSLNKLIDIGKGILDKNRCNIYVMHGAAVDDAYRIYETLKNHPNAVTAEMGGEISPVSGVHSGPGLVGLILMEED